MSDAKNDGYFSKAFQLNFLIGCGCGITGFTENAKP
jgi:hypothetical protein